MWVSEGRILETDRLATNSMHHQGIFELAPELRAAAYDDQGLIEAIEHPDKLVEAVEVRDRSFIMGVQWHPKFFAGTRKMGCLFASLAQEAIRSHTATVDARGRCRLNIKKAPDARSWPTKEYADGI